jgi:hypothetical protein
MVSSHFRCVKGTYDHDQMWDALSVTIVQIMNQLTDQLTLCPFESFPKKSFTYSCVDLQPIPGADKSHMRHGFKDTDGMGVLAISACIGESPRKHRTMVITRTSCSNPVSYASNPSVEITLDR